MLLIIDGFNNVYIYPLHKLNKDECINESLNSIFGIYEGLHINQMILYMSCIDRGDYCVYPTK